MNLIRSLATWVIAALVGLALWTHAGVVRADVQAAYQREFAFLEAEKHALGRRLADLEAESASKLQAAKADVEQLQARALGMSMQAERMTEMLSEIEREVDGAGEDEDLVTTLLGQAEGTLQKGGYSLPEVDGEAEVARVEQVRFAFDKAVSLLARFSQLRQEPGEFFAENGQKVNGHVIHVGRIASYGVSDGASGALAPAGDEKLRIWPENDTARVARGVADGEPPPVLGMFLYESLDKGVERRQEKSAVEVIESGGAIGWVIVGAGLLALLMVLARAVLLWRAASNTSQLVEEITPLLERKDFEDAIQVCRRANNAGGRVLTATLRHLGRDRAELEDVISEAILHEQPALDRFGSSIIVIAAVAPLLGLLGTVTGMIATFDIITEFGTGNPKLLSGGISIALVTTELGLIVAIPALVFGNLLSGWADSIRDGMDKAALRVVNVASGVRLSERPTQAPHVEVSDEPALATS